MDGDKRQKGNRVRRQSGSSTVRKLDYIHVPEISQQPRRRVSFSTIRPLDYIHVPKPPPRECSSSAARTLDCIHVPEISQQPRRRVSLSTIRPLDYIRGPQPPPRECSYPTSRTLNYILAPEPSSQPPQPRTKSSFSARPLDYIHIHEPPARRHSSSSIPRFLDYIHTPEPPSRESSSSVGRTLNYTKHCYNDYERRDPKFTKSRSLDYMHRGPTSEQLPQSAGKWSSSTARSLDYTQFPERSQTDRARRAASFPKARPIDYTASPPPVRRMSSASKIRALDFIHNGNSENVEHVRSRSSLSNIRMIPHDDSDYYPDKDEYTGNSSEDFSSFR